MANELSAYEKAILDAIQSGFPISADPYGEIALKVGGTREAAHAAVVRLRQTGIIRRIGGSFDAKKMGYVSTLVAARVALEHLEAAAAHAGSFPEVTHNYERANSYNLWFTVIAETPSRLEDILNSVRRCPGVEVVEPLPALQTFKIKVNFTFGEGGGKHAE